MKKGYFVNCEGKVCNTETGSRGMSCRVFNKAKAAKGEPDNFVVYEGVETVEGFMVKGEYSFYESMDTLNAAMEKSK